MYCCSPVNRGTLNTRERNGFLLVGAEETMTNIQLYLAIGVPLLFNGVLFIIMVTTFNARFTSLERLMDAKFEAAHQQLLRVEGIFDARLKHLEEERHGQ
jgi:hypothetical protein